MADTTPINTPLEQLARLRSGFKTLAADLAEPIPADMLLAKVVGYLRGTMTAMDGVLELIELHHTTLHELGTNDVDAGQIFQSHGQDLDVLLNRVARLEVRVGRMAQAVGE